jgi:hypothetical protein
MRKFALMIMAVLLSCSMTTTVFAENLKKDDVVYAKYGMRGKGKEIFWHNMGSLPVLVPAGSEVKVVAINAKKVVFMVGGSQYGLLAITSGWDKYFAKNKNEVDISKSSGTVAEGMSKEDVYAIKGCPSYVAWGVKSEFKSLQEVMASDTWYYNINSGRIEVLIKFSNGKVQSIDGHGSAKK